MEITEILVLEEGMYSKQKYSKRDRRGEKEGRKLSSSIQCICPVVFFFKSTFEYFSCKHFLFFTPFCKFDLLLSNFWFDKCFWLVKMTPILAVRMEEKNHQSFFGLGYNSEETRFQKMSLNGLNYHCDLGYIYPRAEIKKIH